MMSEVQTIDAGAVVLDRASAERLDRRIRLMAGSIADSLSKLYDLVEQAKAGQIHVALGFPSWTAYVADACKVEIRVERNQRRELVGWLAGEGMSQRAIAEVVGVGVATVNRDIGTPVPNGTPEPDTGGLPQSESPEPCPDLQDMDPTPSPVTGLDGKTYAKPKRPKPTKATIPDPLDLPDDAKSVVEDLVAGLETVAANQAVILDAVRIAMDAFSEARLFAELVRLERLAGGIRNDWAELHLNAGRALGRLLKDTAAVADD